MHVADQAAPRTSTEREVPAGCMLKNIDRCFTKNIKKLGVPLHDRRYNYRAFQMISIYRY